MVATNHFDVAIVGGGHNGLVAAALLARAGKSVVLCEAQSQFGGAAATTTLAPGMRVPKCAHLVASLDPALIRKLRLKKHGLVVLQKNVGSVALDVEGRHIPLGADAKARHEAIFRWSRHDADAWRSFDARLNLLTESVRPLVAGSALPLSPENRRDQLKWVGHYLGLRRKGKTAFQHVMQRLPSNAADFLDDAFETDLLKGALSLEATMGGRNGPRAPGTIFAWAWQRALQTTHRTGTLQIAGGPEALTQAITASARSFGADLRCKSPVSGIKIEGGRVAGLVLKNGDEVTAPVVLSTISPKATMLHLVGARHLDAGLVRDILQIRTGGASAKVNLALARLPAFQNTQPNLLASRLLIAPCVSDVERAANAQKYNELPVHPVLEVTLPSIRDESLVPEGRHVLSAIVPFMPFDLDAGWDRGGDQLVTRVVKILADYAPDLPDLVMAGEVMTPPDIQDHCGLAGADWHQGELAPDQSMMMRPVPGLAEGRHPIGGLFLGGAGAHPGGGLTGLPGIRAAEQITRAARSGGGHR